MKEWFVLTCIALLFPHSHSLDVIVCKSHARVILVYVSSCTNGLASAPRVAQPRPSRFNSQHIAMTSTISIPALARPHKVRTQCPRMGRGQPPLHTFDHLASQNHGFAARQLQPHIPDVNVSIMCQPGRNVALSLLRHAGRSGDLS